MLTLPPSVKIYVAAQPVDARKSFDGLTALVEAEFGLTPMSGHLFVFLNRRGHVVSLSGASFTTPCSPRTNAPPSPSSTWPISTRSRPTVKLARSPQRPVGRCGSVSRCRSSTHSTVGSTRFISSCCRSPHSGALRAYAINQRAFFRRCFEDGRFEIDNGRVERRIRLFAVARRGFLFTGSVRGGERLAIACTLVYNCLALGIDPECYLVDVIEKLERGFPRSRLSELIPANWAAEKTAEHRAQ